MDTAVLQGLGPLGWQQFLTLLEELERRPCIRRFHATSSGSLVVLALVLHRCLPGAYGAFARFSASWLLWRRLSFLVPALMQVEFRAIWECFEHLERRVPLSVLDAEVSRVEVRIYANDWRCRRVVLEPKTWSELRSAVKSSCNIPVVNPTGAAHWDGVWVGDRDVDAAIAGPYLEISRPTLWEVLAFIVLGRNIRCSALVKESRAGVVRPRSS